jgi:hypothetical protein
MIGVDVFREALGKHEGKFILIGGMAAALQADEVGLEFRPTKDFDVVLVLEALDKTFFDDFWAFVKAGGYSYEKSNGEKQFYRFRKPTIAGYPAQIELFSRKPDLIDLPENAHLTPIPAGEDASSLSAILLDENYYDCLLRGRIISNGIPVLGAGMMIPFKAKAYLDLDQRKNEGQPVKQKEIDKHRADVFSLQGMLTADTQIDIPNSVKGDLAHFLEMASTDAAFDPRPNTGVAKADAIGRFKIIYNLA